MSLFGGDLDLALAAARNGEEPGFAELWNGLQPAVLRYLQAVVGDAAADVASETWQEAAREVRGFGGDAAGFRVWLFRVARVRAMERTRRERRGVVARENPLDAIAVGGAHGGLNGSPTSGPDSPLNTPVNIADGIGENGRAGFGPRAGAAAGIAPGAAGSAGSAGTAGAAGSAGSMGTAATSTTDRALRLVAGLPREESEAVLLRVVAGLDVAQSAMVLGVRDEAARTAAARGLRRLALIVEEAASGGTGGQRGWTAKGWSID